MYTAVVGTYLLNRDSALEAVTVELNIRFSPLSTEYSTALGGLATKRRTVVMLTLSVLLSVRRAQSLMCRHKYH